MTIEKMKIYNPKEFWNTVAPYFADRSPEVQHGEFGMRQSLCGFHNILLGWIDNLKPKNVLQVGIGFGREIKELVKKDYIESITGVDISKKMIEYTRQYVDNNPKVTLLEYDISDLPFSDNTFDLVITVACLTHVQEIERALKQLIRVSKKDIMIVEVPILADNKEGGVAIYHPEIIDVPNHFLWNYENRLKNSGLTILEKNYDICQGCQYVLLWAIK